MCLKKFTAKNLRAEAVWNDTGRFQIRPKRLQKNRQRRQKVFIWLSSCLQMYFIWISTVVGEEKALADRGLQILHFFHIANQILSLRQSVHRSYQSAASPSPSSSDSSDGICSQASRLSFFSVLANDHGLLGFSGAFFGILTFPALALLRFSVLGTLSLYCASLGALLCSDPLRFLLPASGALAAVCAIWSACGLERNFLGCAASSARGMFFIAASASCSRTVWGSQLWVFETLCGCCRWICAPVRHRSSPEYMLRPFA